MDKTTSTITPAILFSSIGMAICKLNPFILWRNPVIFITEIGALITTSKAFWRPEELQGIYIHLAVWLWLTVIFANFAEAIAEIRNKGQAQSLKTMRVKTMAHKLATNGKLLKIPADELRKGDIVVVKAQEIIPGDGEIIHGMASIDESSVTGESQAVIRSSGGDQNSVMAGTKVLSDEIQIRITSNPGESFLDHMITLIEGAKRKKSSNEIALTILLSGLTFIFLIMIISLEIFAYYYHLHISIALQVALLVCLIPTTIAGLLSAIGIAGINRLMRKNVLAMSGQAVESAGDIDTLLIDKTGTITIGNRHAFDLIIAEEASKDDFLKACLYTSLQDETIEGRSIIDLIKTHHPVLVERLAPDMHFIPFSAETRMSGADVGEESYRKGAVDAIEKFTRQPLPSKLAGAVEKIAQQGGTPLLVASKKRILGAIFLKDTLKAGLAKQFEHFRAMGIKTVMLTGDNPITAAMIAKEAGVDDFLAEISPEMKVEYLLERQRKGEMVAMTGDGVNDAPALAHADVGVAMNAGAQAAKEAANMIDLDSHPSKLFEIVEIGKQMLMTRGALTTFSIANDVAKYFAIIPAMLIPFFPFFQALNIMHLSTPKSAVLSAVIFNALIIIFLIPLAFKGVKLVSKNATHILNRNLLIYGIGGVILPFVGIKLIDMIISTFNIA